MKTTAGKDANTDDLVPSGALLDTWSAHGWSNGVLISRLAAFDHLTIQTRHSTYDLVIVSPETAEVLVRGGAFFPDFTPARVAGSSLGGSFLKLHGIYPGFRMELSDGARMIVTSPVRHVEKAKNGGTGMHHENGRPSQLM
jgi:hypothetical protein